MYTTKLLTIIDDRMPRRHQVIAAALIVFLAVASIAGAVLSRPAPTTVQPLAPIIVIATATPRPVGATGLAKEAAPQVAPRVALSAPTAAPLPIVVIAQPMPQVETQPARRVGEKPSDKPGPGEH